MSESDNVLRRIKAIENARQRRVARASQVSKRTQWFIREVNTKTQMSMRSRVRLATEFVKNQVIRNISRPVTKTVKSRQVTVEDSKGRKRKKWVRSTVVTNRSKKGEFPKADTTQLMKTIFSDYREIVTQSGGIYDGFVGTPLDYGLRLEVSKKLDRSFLLRTFNAERGRVMAILTGPLTDPGWKQERYR